MARCRSSLLSLALATSAALAPSAFAQGTPPALLGTWDVVQVAVDLADQPHWLYSPEDPRFLGRELVVGPSSLHLNDDSFDCTGAHWAETKGKLSTLLGKTFRRGPAFDRPRTPTLSDLGLKLPDRPVTRLTPTCPPPEAGRTSAWNDFGFLPLGKDRLLLHEGSTVILLLERRRPRAAPQASFPCTRARSPSERAICQSVALAAWDRSVAAAYRHARRSLSPGETSALQKAQSAWIAQRDACGADPVCLEKAQRERVDALMQE